VALAVVKADLVETGVIAPAAAMNVALKAPESTGGTPYREPLPPQALDCGLFTVLKI